MAIRVDRIEADLAAIGRITQTPGHGATRPTFSPEWAAARDYVIAEAARAGCSARIDAIGNVFIRPDALPTATVTWLCGSHLDTVPHGGDFDGTAGVVAALELLRSAHDDGQPLPLELILFAEEEGTTFGLGMLGSRVLVGDLTATQLAGLKNGQGENVLRAGSPYGVRAGVLSDARLDPSRHWGFIELHIEQGPGLWRRNQPLAAVSAIAGRRQYRVEIHGQANHAGATAMHGRRDALAAAASIIVGLEKLAPEIGEDAVITVGRLDVSPNAVNVIADRATLTVDFRSPDDIDLDLGDRQIRSLIQDVCHLRGDLVHEVVPTESIPAHPMSKPLVDALRRSAVLAGAGELPTTVSGALHDSAVLASHLPTAMLFVASRDGISHNAAEFSRVEDIAAGARVIQHLVSRPTIDGLNGLTTFAFVEVCGSFYEKSPWIAERAAAQKPFLSVNALLAAMRAVVERATDQEQLQLIDAHPDLAGRLAQEGALTSESTQEQASAGLAMLSEEERAAFERLNVDYRQRFGFPFIICARGTWKQAILQAFSARLQNDRETEIRTALDEIHKIAALRARDAIWERPT